MYSHTTKSSFGRDVFEEKCRRNLIDWRSSMVHTLQYLQLALQARLRWDRFTEPKFFNFATLVMVVAVVVWWVRPLKAPPLICAHSYNRILVVRAVHWHYTGVCLISIWRTYRRWISYLGSSWYNMARNFGDTLKRGHVCSVRAHYSDCMDTKC
jgi:hypothetical protein